MRVSGGTKGRVLDTCSWSVTVFLVCYETGSDLALGAGYDRLRIYGCVLGFWILIALVCE